MLEFDETGYLIPHEVIPSSFEDIEKYFVFNAKRQSLYLALRNFVDECKSMELGNFSVWINGSFTTLKKYPKDIDIVVFVHFSAFHKLKLKSESLSQKYVNSLDIFFEPEYPSDHPLNEQTHLDKQYWLELFCFDRKGFGKGIIELKF